MSSADDDVSKCDAVTAGREPVHVPLPKFNARGVSLVTLAVLAVLFSLQQAAPFVIPLIISVLMAYTLDPAVSFLERWKVPRGIGAFVIIALLVAGFWLGLYALKGQAQSIVNQLPGVARKISLAADALVGNKKGGFSSFRAAAEAIQQATGGANNAAGQKVIIEHASLRLRDLLIAGGRSIVELAGQAAMVLFLVFFLLQSGDKFKRKFVKVAGRTLSEKKISVQMLDQVNMLIRRYMAMLLITNACVALATWIVFKFIGLENAGAWALGAGVLHLIPYFGPMMIAVATAGAAFLQFGTIGMALLTGGASILVATLIGTLLTTWMIGRLAKMNAVAIFLSLLLFGWIWGIWGVLLSAPIAVILKVVAEHMEGLEVVSAFLEE